MTNKCDHCGKPLDLENDIDCAEYKMFESRNIAAGVETADFHPIDKGKLYFCGECVEKLNSCWVRSYKGIKAKDRVKNRGEVFTPPYIVTDMCDLIPNEIWLNPLSTFLEPSCGNGNILVEIVARKFERCRTPTQAIGALQSVFGIDILPDNVEESRERVFDLLNERFPDEMQLIKYSAMARSVLEQNIVCADSLKVMEYMQSGGLDFYSAVDKAREDGENNVEI